MNTNLSTPTQSIAGDILRQLAVVLTTLFALAANGAANAIPLNGRNTGEISDSFNVLFVPAGYVFSIWLLIYIGIAAYTIYQALPAQRANPRLRATGWLFALGSLANGAWIFAWHYGLYPLSMAIMLVLLGSLTAIYLRLNIGRFLFDKVETWTIRTPISVYLGWITVATIANATAVLSNLGYTGAPFGELGWTLILLLAGVVIAALMAFTRHEIGYLLVLVWAFAGISVRWLDAPVLNVAGFFAAALVALLLVAGRLSRKASSARADTARQA
jgi:hypothetical protein